MAKHIKHTNLEKRNNDIFAPNEISFLGTNCNTISDLVSKISQNLADYKLAYFDASHSKDIAQNNVSEYVFHHQGNWAKSNRCWNLFILPEVVICKFPW